MFDPSRHLNENAAVATAAAATAARRSRSGGRGCGAAVTGVAVKRKAPHAPRLKKQLFFFGVGIFRMFSDIFGHFRMVLHVFRRFRTLSGVFGHWGPNFVEYNFTKRRLMVRRPGWYVENL